MGWLFLALSLNAFDGSTVTCPKGKFSEIGQAPILRFKSNKSHILICAKDGKKDGDNYYINEFEVYYYNPIEKRLMERLVVTKKGERYRIYSVKRSLFFEELVYDGTKRVPAFRNSILCADNGVCSFASLECVYQTKNVPVKMLPGSLRDRLEKARCL